MFLYTGFREPLHAWPRAGVRICRSMTGAPTWTCLFYVFVFALAVAPTLFVWSYWHEAHTRGWFWISEDSRTMYVDGAKTMITASGIAVALLASSPVSSARTTTSLLAFPSKVPISFLIP